MARAYLITYRVALVKEKGAMYDLERKIGSDVSSSRKAYEAIVAITRVNEEAQEVFGVVTLDRKNKITSIHETARGTLSSCDAHPREIFKVACLHNASSIIIFHNHPSGDPEPSKEDRLITDRICQAGKIMGIGVLDHIVVGDGRYTSFGELGWI